MNTEMMLATAAAIELEPEAFDLGTWLKRSTTTFCGTVGCVAGTAASLTKESRKAALIYLEWAERINANLAETSSELVWQAAPPTVWSIAQEVLELNNYEALMLFTSAEFWGTAISFLGIEDEDQIIHDPMETSVILETVTAKQAAQVVRAIAHGEITINEVED